MTYFPYAPQQGAIYTLTGPRGDIAVFNKPSDPNYVGMLTDITGLDSSGVRESGGPMVGADGGWHGAFFYDRRAITMSGTVFGHSGQDSRAARLSRLMQSSNAMRSDAILSWTNTDVLAVPMQTWVRRQQPLRITGAWNKDFQVQLVSKYAQLFSQVLHTTADGVTATAENQGSSDSAPALTIKGPSTGPVYVTVSGTGSQLTLVNTVTLGSSDVFVADLSTHTATLNGTPANSYIDFSNTVWDSIKMQRAATTVYTIHNAASVAVTWRDTWI